MRCLLPQAKLALCMFSLSLMPALQMSCGRQSDKSRLPDVLVSYGDSVLTEEDVTARIPVGIDPADSVALFRKIVDGWVKRVALSELAREKLPDVDEIERKVSEYRDRLIVSRYIDMMRQGNPAKVSRDSVRAFYEAHRHEMISETPLVKGIYMKLPEASPDAARIRECVFDASGGSIDEIENKWIGQASQYDYFENEWVDWSVIADQIPYRFTDPAAFLAGMKDFEVTVNGSLYLLHISEYLPSGSELPFGFVSSRIESMMERARMARFEDALVESLLKKAISEERLVAVGYDPVRHVRTEKGKTKDNR